MREETGLDTEVCINARHLATFFGGLLIRRSQDEPCQTSPSPINRGLTYLDPHQLATTLTGLCEGIKCQFDDNPREQQRTFTKGLIANSACLCIFAVRSEPWRTCPP